MEERQQIEGGCYCRKVRFCAAGKILSRANCHCGNCRRAAGAQSVAWITVPANEFSFTSGEPKRYRTDTGAYRTFCGECGTSLTYEHDSRPGQIDITTGSLDLPEKFPPTKDVFADEKLSWVSLV
ncbi:MAG TPA: GFA family protein [Chthoniobacterales bacterium]|nr:GFA family protein [Chthoniobacterales bacterium]